MTQVVNTYDKLKKDVALNAETLKDEVVPEIEKINREKKATDTEVAYIESKLTNLENNLPDMIKEIFDYYINQKDLKDKEMYVTHKDLKSACSKKLDCSVFKQFAD